MLPRPAEALPCSVCARELSKKRLQPLTRRWTHRIIVRNRRPGSDLPPTMVPIRCMFPGSSRACVADDDLSIESGRERDTVPVLLSYLLHLQSTLLHTGCCKWRPGIVISDKLPLIGCVSSSCECLIEPRDCRRPYGSILPCSLGRPLKQPGSACISLQFTLLTDPFVP